MRRLIVVSAVALLSGCALFFPSDHVYLGNFARIGSVLYMYVHLCEGEVVSGAEVAAGEGVTSEDVKTRWLVREPVADGPEQGRIAVGVNSEYAIVDVDELDGLDFDHVEIRVWGDDGNRFKVAGVLPRDDASIPQYVDGTDPDTVKYLYTDYSGDTALLTAAQIDERSPCAGVFVS